MREWDHKLILDVVRERCNRALGSVAPQAWWQQLMRQYINNKNEVSMNLQGGMRRELLIDFHLRPKMDYIVPLTPIDSIRVPVDWVLFSQLSLDTSPTHFIHKWELSIFTIIITTEWSWLLLLLAKGPIRKRAGSMSINQSIRIYQVCAIDREIWVLLFKLTHPLPCY